MALNFAHDLTLLNFGSLQQGGNPSDLIKTPKNYFVARFISRDNALIVKKKRQESELAYFDSELGEFTLPVKKDNDQNNSAH